MPPRPEHYALRLQAAPGPAVGDTPMAGELEAVYSGECRAFEDEAGLLAALRALRQSAQDGAAAAPPGPADAAQRRSSRSP
jgi:hypothetical protein